MLKALLVAFVCATAVFVAMVIVEKETAPAPQQPGVVSIQLSHAVVRSQRFWRSVGAFIARISDFLYLLEDFFQTAWRILELLCHLSVSWLYTFCGYWDTIVSYAHPMRAVIGTVLGILALLLLVERRTQWLNRFLDACCQVQQEEQRQPLVNWDNLGAREEERKKAD